MTANEVYRRVCEIVRTGKAEIPPSEEKEFWKIVRGGLAIAATKIPAEEAIDILASCFNPRCESCPQCGNECAGYSRTQTALDMAISALERQIPIGAQPLNTEGEQNETQ